MINQMPHTLDEVSAEDPEGDEEFSTIIASINLLHLRKLALPTRRKLYNDLLPETSCVVSNPPRMGALNIVYELSFSDGIKWIRVPAAGDVFKPSRSRSFYLDIVIQRFISSETSMPMPRIQVHHWSLDSHNILSRPFVIMDFMSGTNLSKLWNDKNWIAGKGFWGGSALRKSAPPPNFRLVIYRPEPVPDGT